MASFHRPAFEHAESAALYEITVGATPAELISPSKLSASENWRCRAYALMTWL